MLLVDAAPVGSTPIDQTIDQETLMKLPDLPDSITREQLKTACTALGLNPAGIRKLTITSTCMYVSVNAKRADATDGELITDSGEVARHTFAVAIVEEASA